MYFYLIAKSLQFAPKIKSHLTKTELHSEGSDSYLICWYSNRNTTLWIILLFLFVSPLFLFILISFFNVLSRSENNTSGNTTRSRIDYVYRCFVLMNSFCWVLERDKQWYGLISVYECWVLNVECVSVWSDVCSRWLLWQWELVSVWFDVFVRDRTRLAFQSLNVNYFEPCFSYLVSFVINNFNNLSSPIGFYYWMKFIANKCTKWSKWTISKKKQISMQVCKFMNTYILIYVSVCVWVNEWVLKMVESSHWCCE